MTIVNLTMHEASTEQVEAGVFNLQKDDLDSLKQLLTFEELPTEREVFERAVEIANLVPEGVESAMIGGAPFLMHPLENALNAKGVGTSFAFSRRESVEKTTADGAVVKTSVFKHLGFINR